MSDISEIQDAHLIAVVGPTGAGKTSFTNIASNSSFGVGHLLDSCTAEIQLSPSFTVDDKPVVLIDTPGFDDTDKTEVEILQLISDFLVKLYTNEKKLSGIIFIHRITDVRMGGISTKNFRLFRQLCGESSLKNVMIVTNGWSSVEDGVGEEREQQLTTDSRFFQPALDKGAQIVRYTDSTDSAHEIIRQVLHLPPIALRIQEELVDENKQLMDTGAATEIDEVNKEIEEQKRKHEEEVRATEERMRQEHERQQEELRRLQEEQERDRIQREQEEQERDRIRQEEHDRQVREEQERMEHEQRELEARIAEERAREAQVVHHDHDDGPCCIQ